MSSERDESFRPTASVKAGRISRDLEICKQKLRDLRRLIDFSICPLQDLQKFKFAPLYLSHESREETGEGLCSDGLREPANSLVECSQAHRECLGLWRYPRRCAGCEG